MVWLDCERPRHGDSGRDNPCDAIVSAIAREYRPLRVYQWGPLVNERHFSQEKLIRFPLDIIAIEHVHPADAAHIRRRGRMVYER